MIELRLKKTHGDILEIKIEEDTDLNVVLITDHSGETVAISKDILTDVIGILDKIDNNN